MHDRREARQALLDLFEDVEAELLVAMELERAMGGADCAREGVASHRLRRLTKYSASEGLV